MAFLCVSAYSENDLAGESWYTEKVCLQHDCARGECASNKNLLYCHTGPASSPVEEKKTESPQSVQDQSPPLASCAHGFDREYRLHCSAR